MITTKINANMLKQLFDLHIKDKTNEFVKAHWILCSDGSCMGDCTGCCQDACAGSCWGYCEGTSKSEL